MKNYLKIPLITFVLLFAWGSSAMNKSPWIHEVRIEVRTDEDVKRLCGGQFDVKNLKFNSDERTILTHASLHGETDVVAALLEAGVDIESTDGQGVTALQVATYCGRLPVVKLLIDRKAKINARSLGGSSSALHFAARHNQEAASTLLIAAGAALDLKNRDGATSLQDACRHGHLKLAKLLAAVMAYQDKNFPEYKHEEVEIGREIGLAMREAEQNRREYPKSENPEHTKIIEFIKTLRNPKLRSRI